jgi:hypothetical protein
MLDASGYLVCPLVNKNAFLRFNTFRFGTIPTRHLRSVLLLECGKARTMVRIGPHKQGGLNGSMQHYLAVYLPESQNPKSFAVVDLSAALPCRGLLENSQTSRFF